MLKTLSQQNGKKKKKTQSKNNIPESYHRGIVMIINVYFDRTKEKSSVIHLHNSICKGRSLQRFQSNQNVRTRILIMIEYNENYARLSLTSTVT